MAGASIEEVRSGRMLDNSIVTSRGNMAGEKGSVSMAGTRSTGPAGWRRWFLVGCAVCLAIALLTIALARWRTGASANRDRWRQYVAGQADPAGSAFFERDFVQQVEAFCSDCHGMPVAGSYPRDAWHGKVRRAYEYYARSGRNDLDPPPIHRTAAYFRAQAPEQLVLPQPPEAITPAGITFLPQPLHLSQEKDVQPGISYLRWTELEPGGQPVLLVCDMRRGHVSALDLRGANPLPRILAQLDNPCHAEPCDLDGDGVGDLVVAELGSFLAGDHDRGQVLWLRGQQAGGEYEKIVIASGLGRVADVQPVDTDGDGDLDLLVAEFGYHKTGKIALFKNVATAGDRPQFELQVLDPRPGASHILVHDLNDDGRPDFLALVSQEYEWVASFLNQGNGQFHRQTVWAAPEVTFGLTGVRRVDLDRDGDDDLLLTNGDTFDDQYVKPSHGVQWLENLGGERFAHRPLTSLPGVHGARAEDFDRDGDLDVIAVSWLHDQPYPVTVASQPLASIVYLEQTAPGVFGRHTLEVGFPCHAALEVADFDSDGDLDFAVGWQLSRKWHELPHLTVWRNQLVTPTSDSPPPTTKRKQKGSGLIVAQMSPDPFSAQGDRAAAATGWSAAPHQIVSQGGVEPVR